MWVESVTLGSPHEASTLKRLGATGRRSARPPCLAASSDTCAKSALPIHSSFSVTDSMSTNARVSSNTFIDIRERMEGGRGYSVRVLPGSAPSDLVTHDSNDSGQVLSLPPNRARRKLPRPISAE